MTSGFLALLFPSFIVTLFAIGCLTMLLRKNAFHALLGLTLMAWSPAFFLADVGTRSTNPEGNVLAVVLVFCVGLNTLAGILLIQWLADTTGRVDLDS